MKNINSSKYIKLRRNDLMSNTTNAEKAAVRNVRRLGYECVLQYPIQTGRKLYYADVYIPKLRLIIEIDGGYHSTNEQKRKDRNRSAGIRRLGYHVVRLSNHDARDKNKVQGKIRMILHKAKRTK